MMINVDNNIQLKEISRIDIDTLFKLMKEIYPPAYSHFWMDKGEWYLNNQYSKDNILKELSEVNTDYYFVIFKDKIIGNFRIIWNKKLKDIPVKKQVKLHRVYLHPNAQGKAIGKKLLFWLEEKAVQKGCKFIWLDVMQEQPQAFDFYKSLGYKYYSHSFLPFKKMYDSYRKMNQVYKNLNNKDEKN